VFLASLSYSYVVFCYDRDRSSIELERQTCRGFDARYEMVLIAESFIEAD